MTRDRLSGYGELIDVLEDLPVILRETCRRKRQSLQQAAANLGVATTTVMRWENEIARIPVTGAVSILRWAGT